MLSVGGAGNGMSFLNRVRPQRFVGGIVAILAHGVGNLIEQQLVRGAGPIGPGRRPDKAPCAPGRHRPKVVILRAVAG